MKTHTFEIVIDGVNLQGKAGIADTGEHEIEYTSATVDSTQEKLRIANDILNFICNKCNGLPDLNKIEINKIT